MQTQETPKRTLRWTILISIAGTLLLLFTCSLAVGSLFLDVAGVKTTGVVENVARCSGARTCFTAQISFQTSGGETVAYKPFLQNTWIYEVHRLTNIANNVSGSAVSVRYLETAPQLAKVHLSYSLEYANLIIWLFWSLVIFFIGWIINRRGGPITLDFRKKKS